MERILMTPTIDHVVTTAQNHQIIWTMEEALALFALPFNDLLYRAHETHRHYWDVNTVQLSTLLSVKTGGCGEDCKYCGQSSHYDTPVKVGKLMELSDVRAAARKAKAAGVNRLCIGAAWRELRDRDLEHVAGMISIVKKEGLESCVTLGLLTEAQATLLKKAGLDYYNHNIDTSEEYYGRIITTHTFKDRLDTLNNVRIAGLKVCSGGIIGVGESRADRATMLATLASLQPPPESVPINVLVPIPGTPLAKVERIDPLELVRTIAVTRLLMPCAMVRLSAGRASLTEEAQALCFFTGINSIFYGEHLLTADNSTEVDDQRLFAKLGLRLDAVEKNPLQPQHGNISNYKAIVHL